MMARHMLVFVFLCSLLVGTLEATGESCDLVVGDTTHQIPSGESVMINEACGTVSCLENGNLHFHMTLEGCDLSAALQAQAGKR